MGGNFDPNMGPGGPMPPMQNPPMGGPPMGGPGGPPGAPPAQPLPSNVLGKGNDRTMDQQYMQQSSQVYVFSTQWANRGAEAVMQSQFPSIISWHESQPETKKLLEVRQIMFRITFGKFLYFFFLSCRIWLNDIQIWQSK